MLSIKNKKISRLYIKEKSISELFANLRKIYTAIKSCFGRGFWINEKPWDNLGSWRNL